MRIKRNKTWLLFSKNREIKIQGEKFNLLEGFDKEITKLFNSKSPQIISFKLLALAYTMNRAKGKPDKDFLEAIRNIKVEIIK